MCVCVYVLVSVQMMYLYATYLSFVTSPYCFVAVPVEIIIISKYLVTKIMLQRGRRG